MSLPIGGLSMAELECRFLEGIRDSTIASGPSGVSALNSSYRYLNDAYQKYFYADRWDFRKQEMIINCSAGVTAYVLDNTVDIVRGIWNKETGRSVRYDYDYNYARASWNDKFNSGELENLIDVRDTNGVITLLFRETPGPSGQGDGAQIYVNYFAHLFHLDASGNSATGAMNASTDIPAWDAAFHPLVVLSAIRTAMRNKRQFGEGMAAITQEEQELYTLMKRRYLQTTFGGRTQKVIR